MTSTTHCMSAAAGACVRPSRAPGLAGVLEAWWAAFWKRRAQRATVMMLRGLDDRALHDIGVDRSEIESVVYGRPGERLRAYEGLRAR